MKNLIVFALALLFASSLCAQLWEPLGGGTSTFVEYIYSDSTTEGVYLVGQFKYAGDSLVNGIAFWDGSRYTTVGGGFPDESRVLQSSIAINNRPASVLKFENLLFVSGTFDTVAGQYPADGLTRWDGIRWRECGESQSTLGFHVLNGQLFGFGFLEESPSGQIQVFGKWNGTKFEPFGEEIQFSHIGERPYTGEFFNGEYYVGGNFTEPNGIKEIIRWNGTNWLPLDEGILGDAGVRFMKAFHDQLFVAGLFYQADGNAKDYIMAWDGSTWYDPLPGVRFDTQLSGLRIIGDKLYLVGNHFVFTGAGWEGPYGIARYDGVNFCSFGGIGASPTDVVGFGNEIIVKARQSIRVIPINGSLGDSVKYIGSYTGGDSNDVCISQLVHASTPLVQTPEVSLFPNPSLGTFRVKLPKDIISCEIRVFDARGSQVLSQNDYRDEELALLESSDGLYFIEVSWKSNRAVMRLMLRR